MVSVVKGLVAGSILLIAVLVFKLQIHSPTFYTMLGAELAAAFAGGIAEGVKKSVKGEDA